MPRLIIVIGLTGSGKTTYLEKIKANGEIDYMFDDFHACAAGNSHKIEASKYFNKLSSCLSDRKNCAIADIEFCKLDHLEYMITELVKLANNITIEYRYFENDPKTCIQNIKFRKRGDMTNQIDHVKRYTKFYNIPEGVTPMLIPDAQSLSETSNP
jgi:predicted kinase